MHPISIPLYLLSSCRLKQPVQLVLGPEGIRERPALEVRLEGLGPAGLTRLELELERVDDVVEEVRLADRDAGEGHVGEVDLRRARKDGEGEGASALRRGSEERERGGRTMWMWK